MAEQLNDAQINAALVALRSWSGETWSDAIAMSWKQVLRHYRPGELSKLLDTWSLSAKGHFRPTPGDLARLRSGAPLYQAFQPLSDVTCEECDDTGFVEVDSDPEWERHLRSGCTGCTDFKPSGITYSRPCERCKPELYDRWKKGGLANRRYEDPTRREAFKPDFDALRQMLARRKR